ncbi:MAG: N-acetylmuramoyl-L-alanine amidase [Clostridia bacterium]|nr:N-acetylmuramoyl-L-alanine amidase [Clostridia bacterium]
MKQTTFAALAALTTAFVVAIILCLHALWLPQAVFAATDAKMTVVLDAGHGGIDGGVTGKTTGIKESEINLAITLALKEELTDMGFEVILTRKTDAGLYDTTAKGFKKRDMQRRKEIIQAATPSLVISLHQNFYPSQSTRGAQVFYGKADDNSKRLANCLQTQLNGLYAKQEVKPRHSMPAEYFILQCSTAPTALIECGFLSSARDEALLSSPAFRENLAKSIAAGIMDFFAENTA